MIRNIALFLLCLVILTSCFESRAQRDAAAKAAGDVGMLFGLPRPLVEGTVGSILLAIGHLSGHKRGVKVERKRVACKLPPPPTEKA